MKKLFIAIITLSISLSASAQTDCFKQLEDAFVKRGSYTVADEMHKNVIISFFTPIPTPQLKPVVARRFSGPSSALR